MIRLPLVAAIIAAPAAAQSFSYPDFTSTAGLSLVERAATSGSVMRVHDAAAPSGGGNRGAVWRATPVDVAGGFSTEFVFNINTPSSTGGGDGMAFVIQNEQVAGDLGTIGSEGIGRHASALGYGLFTGSAAGESIDNSLVIEIDNFFNGNQPAASPILDPDSNHISVHTGGSGENSQNESFSIGRADTTQLGSNTNDGLNHTIRIDYVPGLLEVAYDGVVVISTPYSFASGGTWIDSGTPVGGLNLVNGTQAFVGFTASSGGVNENHDLVSWTFASGSPTLGMNYCMANVNSTGVPAQISATGSASVAVNDVVLRCSDLPPQQFGIFVVSETQAFTTGVGGGVLCLGGQIGRYNLPSQILNAGTAGQFALPIDLTMIPLPTSFATVQAGETWNFQAWFRDAGTGSNFSNAVEITFVN